MNDEQAKIIEVLKEMLAKGKGDQPNPLIGGAMLAPSAQTAPHQDDTCTCDKTPRCPCCGKKLPAEQLGARWQINLPGSPTY